MSEILDLKRRAVALKREGDVKGALSLLRQARQLEQQKQQLEETVDPSNEKQISEPKDEPDQQSGKTVAQTSPQSKETDTTQENEGDDQADELKDLLQEDGHITYTDEEMKNCELMTEFKLGGMPVPSNDEYQAKILAAKKKALAFKNAGNIAEAKNELVNAKQLETVRVALSHMEEGLGLRINEDNDGWLEELSEPDSALVGNMLNKNGAPMVLDMEDLDAMSPEELSDAVDMGMELPSVEHIMAAASEKKTLALQFKQKGDLEGARAALLAFKELQAVASKIESLHRQNTDAGGDGDGGEMSMEALESLVEEASGQRKEKQPEPKKSTPTRSAAELRQEAVRLRNENKTKEATKVLKLYKAALQREEDAAEKKRIEAFVEKVRKEILVAEQQHRFFQFYERFVDEKVGAEQLAVWNNYIKKCEDATKLVLKKESKCVSICRSVEGGALSVPDEKLVDFVERGAGESEERLEVAIFDVRNIRENKTFLKLDRGSGKEEAKSTPTHILKVDVTIHIPPSEEDRDKALELVFESSPSVESDSPYVYSFGPSKFVEVPRGDSKFASAVRRRMERRKINIAVYHVPHEIKQKGWFGGRAGAQAASNGSNPTLLGKVALELKDILKRNCVAGDFPLMTSTRLAGGTLGLVVRTGVPFDKEQFESTRSLVELEQFEGMKFAAPIE